MFNQHEGSHAFQGDTRQPTVHPDTIQGRGAMLESYFSLLREEIIRRLGANTSPTITAEQFRNNVALGSSEVAQQIRRPYERARASADPETRKTIDATLALKFVNGVVMDPNSAPDASRDNPPVRLTNDNGKYRSPTSLDSNRRAIIDALLGQARTYAPDALAVIKEKYGDLSDPNDGRLALEELMTLLEDYPPKGVNLETWRKCFENDFKFDADRRALFEQWTNPSQS